VRVLTVMIANGTGLELPMWAVGWRFAKWSDFAADTWGVVGASLLGRGLQFVLESADQKEGEMNR
jgi:hypothetical protein